MYYIVTVSARSARHAVRSDVCQLPEEPHLHNICYPVKRSIVADTTFTSTAADAEPDRCLLIRLQWQAKSNELLGACHYNLISNSWPRSFSLSMMKDAMQADALADLKKAHVHIHDLVIQPLPGPQSPDVLASNVYARVDMDHQLLLSRTSSKCLLLQL